MKNTGAALSLLLLLPAAAFSQSVKTVPVFKQGEVVISSTGRSADGELSVSREAYSDYVIGVYNEKSGMRNLPSVIESGIAYVKFDADSGHVVKGDYVATSPKHGQAMKANSSGTVLGVALADSRALRNLLPVRIHVIWVKR
jgi:hypothetical protein